MTAATDAALLIGKARTPNNSVSMTKARLAAARADTSYAQAKVGSDLIADVAQMVRKNDIIVTDR